VKSYLSTALILFFALAAFAQSSSVIGTTFVADATARSNGFKLVSSNRDFPSGEFYAVYMFDPDTIVMAHSTDNGDTWVRMSVLMPGPGWTNPKYPSIDIFGTLPVIAYQADSGGLSEIFLECPYDYGIPTRISFTHGNSVYPAIVVDDTAAVHVVWQENYGGFSDIYYYEASTYSDYPGSVTEALTTSPTAYDRYPSISIFADSCCGAERVHVLWETEDPPSDTPYRINHAIRVGSVFAPTDMIDCHWTFLGNPSLDYCHGEGGFSAAWERATEINFIPADSNWSTYATSNRPVISSMPGYDYFYWEVDSAAMQDIYYDHCYYGYHVLRWGYKFCDCIADEPPKYPSANGCAAIWTEGKTAPFEVKFVYNGYPIGIDESPSRPEHFTVSAFPNPFNSAVRISVGEGLVPSCIEIFDIAGRRVETLRSSATSLEKGGKENTPLIKGVPENDNSPLNKGGCPEGTGGILTWQPANNIGSGVYLVRAKVSGESVSKRIVYLK